MLTLDVAFSLPYFPIPSLGKTVGKACFSCATFHSKRDTQHDLLKEWHQYFEQRFHSKAEQTYLRYVKISTKKCYELARI